MASPCLRLMSRSSLSSIKSAIRSSAARSATGKSPSSAPRLSSPSMSSPRRFTSRIPSELGCVQSLLPLHSAVAAARMTCCLSTTSSSRALSQGT